MSISTPFKYHMNEELGSSIDKAHRALTHVSGLGVGCEQVIAFGILLKQTLEAEGYLVEAIVSESYDRTIPELILYRSTDKAQQLGVYVRIRYCDNYFEDGTPFYTMGCPRNKHGNCWWDIAVSMKELIIRLQVTITEISIKMQCGDCHYSNAAGMFCGKGLEGTGDCNQYRRTIRSD